MPEGKTKTLQRLARRVARVDSVESISPMGSAATHKMDVNLRRSLEIPRVEEPRGRQQDYPGFVATVGFLLSKGVA